MEQSKTQVEKEARMKWDNDPSLQVEFGDDFEAFLHYTMANNNGQIKIKGTKQAR